jgi:hypothetical protein
VPLYIGRAEPEAKVLSVGMIELVDGAPAEPLHYDFVVFTEPFDRGDPCADFIKSRQKQ